MPTIPTIFLIMIINFFIIYWIDKYLLLRFYRTPKNYDEETIMFTLSKFKWAFLIHAILGTIMLSN